MAGEVGFEPTENARVKVWCLTAWLLANIDLFYILIITCFSLKVNSKLHYISKKMVGMGGLEPPTARLILTSATEIFLMPPQFYNLPHY